MTLGWLKASPSDFFSRIKKRFSTDRHFLTHKRKTKGPYWIVKKSRLKKIKKDSLFWFHETSRQEIKQTSHVQVKYVRLGTAPGQLPVLGFVSTPFTGDRESTVRVLGFGHGGVVPLVETEVALLSGCEAPRRVSGCRTPRRVSVRRLIGWV